ncbi:hypothetical protein [Streptosporangium sp. NBC_01756]|uniref:hypothetical protein n=1 Tax=Streptosporangium sp. NBC_01756 TaxID=2975950 RepID=UPI002DD7D87E|nr:hypothetical protein [Streptosporangium sp. NBC_01756]WSC86985.1 hypothetical protein OIE48_01810 [Streptosporangium sp. NBC_01756]
MAELHPIALEEFCAESALSAQTLAAALRDLTRTGEGVVVLCGSAYRNRGIEPLLDAVVAYLPSPLDVPAVRGPQGGAVREQIADPVAPFAALVFKVNSTATGRLTYLRVYSGTIRKGDAVLDAGVGRPQVAYRETVASGVSGLLYRHVKQDGGTGQFAHVVLDVEPLETAPDAGDNGGGAVGFVFRTAGRIALREALRACAMVLLEPVAEVTATVPDDAVGGVLGDMAARRGRVSGSTARAGTVVITATVPLAELFGYATRLRSRTQGRGTFTTRATGYAPAPGAVPTGTPR